VQNAIAPNYISYVVPAIIIAMVMVFRMRRMARSVPLNLTWIWVIPVLYGALAVLLIAVKPPAPAMIGWLVGAFAIGGVLGWYRGKTVRITRDGGSGKLMQQASPAAAVILIVLIVIRQGVRSEASAFGVDASLAPEVLLVFAAAMFTMGAIERYIRARRLLTQPPPSPLG